MHDLLSGQAREIVRTVWDGKQPTALAFLYANSARLLGFLAGDNSNEIILGPVLAVGSAAGTVTLLNLSTLQVCTAETPHDVTSAGTAMLVSVDGLRVHNSPRGIDHALLVVHRCRSYRLRTLQHCMLLCFNPICIGDALPPFTTCNWAWAPWRRCTPN